MNRLSKQEIQDMVTIAARTNGRPALHGEVTAPPIPADLSASQEAEVKSGLLQYQQMAADRNAARKESAEQRIQIAELKAEIRGRDLEIDMLRERLAEARRERDSALARSAYRDSQFAILSAALTQFEQETPALEEPVPKADEEAETRG